jgi:hypothetical protein
MLGCHEDEQGLKNEEDLNAATIRNCLLRQSLPSDIPDHLFLPFPNLTRDDTEHGVRIRGSDFPHLAMDCWSAPAKFCAQVLPLKNQLSARFIDLSAQFPTSDFGPIKLVSAALRLPGQAVQERSDCHHGLPLRTKPRKLRVVFVSTCAALKHLLCKQGLAPGRNQSFGIQIPRM